MTLTEVKIEPMTRLEGHLGVHAVADLEKKTYTDAHSFVTMFRGWELILRNREPADAPWLTQRVCGVCPVPHGIASVMAVDMAYKAPPPPMGIALRNLAFGSEQLYDAAIGCFVLEGPDYSQSIVEQYNPDWWDEAQRTKPEHSDIHGYEKISDIMTGLNPITGELWLRSLSIEKLGRKMASLLGAKHPHINTLIPGGMSLTVRPTELEQFASMLSQHVAFAKEFIPIFNDLMDFVLDMDYGAVGQRELDMISNGAYEDPSAYTAKYEDLSDWGVKRRVTPGVVINGEVISNDLLEIHLGVRDHVDRSYYEDSWETGVTQDPMGNAVDKQHPWNKQTIPAPGDYADWNNKYSWAIAPRWLDWKKRADGESHSLEAGPVCRLYITAKSKKVPESTGESIKFSLPKATIVGYKVSDEMDFEWKAPKLINTVERVRARAYYYAYSAYVMYQDVLKGLELVKAGKAKVWNRYRKPRDGLGVGMVDAMRGALAHWVVMKNQRIANYQIISPSTWNAGPRLNDDDLSPYESAIIGSPVTEAYTGNELYGVDVVRVVRAFDPCLACCVHLYKGDKKIGFIPEI